MEQLLQALNQARSRDQSVRKPAEDQLKQWEHQCFGQYLIGLCQVLENQQNPSDIRQLAGLQIKLCVGGGKAEASQDILVKRYLALPEQTREALRQAVTPILGTDLEKPRKVAAQIVARIASIELPRKMWPKLIPMLKDVVTKHTGELRESALVTLGFIGEELSENEEVFSTYAGTILNAVQVGVLDNRKETKLAAGRAMLHCLPYIRQNMEDQAQRKVVLEMILCCCNCPGNDQVEINTKIAGFQSLCRLAKLYYEHLQESMQLCAVITWNSMSANQHVEVRKFAIEFWSCVFEEEVEIDENLVECQKLGMTPSRQNAGYAKKACSKLCPMLLEILKSVSSNIDDIDDWTIDETASHTLSLLALAIKDDILPLMQSFIEQNLPNQNSWQSKFAATKAIAIIMNGPSQKTTVTVARQVWRPFLEQYVNSNPILQDATAYAISQIFKHCNSAIDLDNLQLLVKVFCLALQKSHAKVARTTCIAIWNLADITMRFQASTPLSKYLVDLLRALLACANRPDVMQHNLLSGCFTAIYCLVRSSGHDMIPVLSDDLLPQMVRELEQLTSNIMQGGQVALLKTCELMGVIGGVINRVQRLTDDHARQLMNIYTATLNRNFTSSVHEEALGQITTIAEVIQGRFVPYLETVSTMISIGLTESHSHPTLCQNCLILLGAVASACREKIEPFADQFVRDLLENLANPELPFHLKPLVVDTISDIAGALGPSFEKYVLPVMKFLLQACDAVAQAANPSSQPCLEEMKEFNALREAVLGCFINIMSSLTNRNEKLINCYGEMIQAVLRMNTAFPSALVQKYSLNVIEDMLKQNPRQAFAYVLKHKEFVEQFLSHGMQSQDEDTKLSAENIVKRIQSLN